MSRTGKQTDAVQAVADDSYISRIWCELRPYRHGLFVLFIPFCAVLTWLAQANPEIVEQIYSCGIYPALSMGLGWFFGLLPVSVAELLIYAGTAGVLARLIAGILRLVRKEEKKRSISGIFSGLGCALGIGYLLFTLLCGFNYYRVTFADQSGLKIRPSSAEDLAMLYAELIEEANEARRMVAQNEIGVMVFTPETVSGMAQKAPEGMALAAKTYPMLGGFTPRPKLVFASRAMSALDITGIYIPFTFEANVNVDVPQYNIPFSMMHELAHFKGFMREDEANFIAFLACRGMGDPAYRYSGFALALIHCGNALYSADSGLYWQLSAEISEDVQRDFDDNSAYWKQFEGPVSDAAEKVNDAYLKTNRQVEGVESYGRMVDLLLADYRMRHGLD